jgi:regulator of sigma E protease
MDFGRVLITIVLFFVTLGILVIVHELGHFVVAKLSRVRVLEFGVGFPPRAKILGRRAETLYTLNYLPIGGFVRLEGEDGDSADDPRSFSAQRLWLKLVILVAGVVMNVVLAFVIFLGVAWLATPLVGVAVPEIQSDSPASRAGLVAGDELLTVDGQVFDLYSEDLISAIRKRAGETIVLGVRHADRSRSDVGVTLRSTDQIDATHGALGISAGTAGRFREVFYDSYRGRPFDEAFGIAVSETKHWSGLILGGLGDLARGFVSDPTAPPGASGPVGIAVQLGDIFFGAGWVMTLYVAALFSVNLAVVNILPFPPLDGGRMLMLVLRRVVGDRLSLRVERLTYVVGAGFLLLFFVYVTGFDVFRLLGMTT